MDDTTVIKQFEMASDALNSVHEYITKKSEELIIIIKNETELIRKLGFRFVIEADSESNTLRIFVEKKERILEHNTIFH